MIDRALDAGTPAGWAAGDEVDGADPALRTDLAARGLGYVLAVAKSCRFTTGIGPRRAIDLAVRLPGSCWQRLSAGTGAKGERWYNWALAEVSDPAVTKDSGPNWLLIRRLITRLTSHLQVDLTGRRRRPLRDRLTDLLFVQSGPSVHADLVGDRRWSNDAYQSWLTTVVENLLASQENASPSGPATQDGSHGPGGDHDRARS